MDTLRVKVSENSLSNPDYLTLHLQNLRLKLENPNLVICHSVMVIHIMVMV